MYQEFCRVTANNKLKQNVFVLRFHAPHISRNTKPGQFLNIKVSDNFDPLLRRAYSVHQVVGEDIEIIFNIVGKGSALLAQKQTGDLLDVLGLLGVPFDTNSNFGTAILISGGLGVAPMPITAANILKQNKKVVNIHGARTKEMLIDDDRLHNPIFCTDDGSAGVQGNVVSTLDKYLASYLAENNISPDNKNSFSEFKIFACGPNQMLIALGEYCLDKKLELEVSLECQMACGVGICQGCPVEMLTGEKKYSLVCTHGPNYNYKDINIKSLLTGAH